MQKNAIFFLIFLLINTTFCFADSHFDNIEWKLSRTDKEITMYTVNAGDCNFYKAETVYKPNKSLTAQDFLNALSDYDEYMQIFKKIMVFKPVLETDEGTVIFVRSNFSPMKHRVYYIVLKTYQEGDSLIMEWWPYEGTEGIAPLPKGCKRVNLVYGKWIITNNPDGTIYISNEYHNNWEYGGIPLSTVTPFEENVSIKNIRLLIEHVESK